MGVTIKDIAKLAHVSHTTVSRALNDSPLIKEETKQRIKLLATQLNYVPDYNAKSLVLQKSYTIGLFFTTIVQGTSPNFFYEAVKGMSRSINENYNLVIKAIDEYQNDYSSITRRRFDGIVLMSQSEDDDSFVQHAIENDLPLVVLNREISGAHPVVNILSDDRHGVFNAVRHLIENGHREIALIEGKEGFYSTKVRKEGFMQALKEWDIRVRPEYVVPGNYDTESGYVGMEKLLRLPQRPTAVFCSNDDMAVGAMRAAVENNLSVPGDISIMGFDDIGVSGYLTPPLTTVKRPIEEITIRAGEKILEIIENKQSQTERIFINTDLVLRHTVQSLRVNESDPQLD